MQDLRKSPVLDMQDLRKSPVLDEASLEFFSALRADDLRPDHNYFGEEIE
jgi:hypothetical protein